MVQFNVLVTTELCYSLNSNFMIPSHRILTNHFIVVKQEFFLHILKIIVSFLFK